jgi:hypothetical protein
MNPREMLLAGLLDVNQSLSLNLDVSVIRDGLI